MCCFGRASQLSSTCLKENGSRSAINHSQKNLLRWFSFESLLEFWIIPLKNFSFRDKKKKKTDYTKKFSPSFMLSVWVRNGNIRSKSAQRWGLTRRGQRKMGDLKSEAVSSHATLRANRRNKLLVRCYEEVGGETAEEAEVIGKTDLLRKRQTKQQTSKKTLFKKKSISLKWIEDEANN